MRAPMQETQKIRPPLRVGGFWTAKTPGARNCSFSGVSVLPVNTAAGIPALGYASRDRVRSEVAVTESFRTGSICFFITTWEFQNPRGWKAIGTRGSCSGSAVNFWAPGGSVGARPEASFVLPSIHIVEKISFCIIRSSLNFYFQPDRMKIQVYAACMKWNAS